MLGNYFLITSSCLLDEKKKPRYKAIETISALNRNQIPFCILTSNTKYKLGELAKYYASFGFYDIYPNNFYTSSMAAIDYLVSNSDDRYEMHLAGSGLVEALRTGGFTTNLDKANYVFIGSEQEATFDDYSDALDCLMNGAKLICLDHTLYEKKHNKYVLGPGSITLMLEAATKKKAMHFSLPSRIIVDKAIGYLGANKEETLIVGSHIDEELLSSIKLELNTALITQDNIDEDIMSLSDKPMYFLRDISSILDSF